MNRQLLLLRHAKSSWDDPVLGDHDRPLAARGRRAAPLIGDYLHGAGLIPDRVWCSTAQRATETWQLVAESAGIDVETDYDSGIYHAEHHRLIRLIQHFPPDCIRAMLIGHNPAMEMLALELIGRDGCGRLDSLQAKYPTAALAVIDFKADLWADIRPGSGTLQAFIKPRELA